MAIIKKFRIKSFKKINTIIEFENISLAYGNRLILDNLNFSINEGQIFGMLGPNGVGKSTIFNLITGLISLNGKINSWWRCYNHPIYTEQKVQSGHLSMVDFSMINLHDNSTISEIEK